MKNLVPQIIVAIVSSCCTFVLCLYFFQRHPVHSEQVTTQLVSQPAPLNASPRNWSASTLPDFTKVARQVTGAVASISAFNVTGYRVASGSGVVITTDGYIVTNYHVVQEGQRFEVALPDKRSLPARVVGVDESTDLALLRVAAEGLPALALGDSDQLEVGEWVLAVGSPFDLYSTVTAGIVSAKARNINILQGIYAIESFIQTDAVVNPGNSGGALVNTQGELVGINTAIISESGGYEGYSFAIPVNLVKKVMADMRQYGEVKRAVLGVNISDVNARIAADLSLPGIEGVYVTHVNEGSSAYEAGLRMGDVIISVNGTRVSSVPELQERVALYRPGDRVSLEYYREGRKHRSDNVVLKSMGSAAAYGQR
ncbi:MAG TPA: trypsin-like peptidase domain-containing protein [Saprospiraceae bacterium]|nr:trypsin-like peptidase domain-containing protein [Saprospiraceae bacterium]HMP25812.1 trypsin-like peptidase domain-containing protein [Saprospiraceae bacterium]